MHQENVVQVRRHGHVLLITLNRPQVRNAVNLAVTLGVGDALELAEHDPEIRAVVLTGAGDKAFCSGADLKAIARGESLKPAEPHRAAWGFAGYVRHHISKPTIAAVNGPALGGGTEICLASDLIVAADTATFGLPEVRRGVAAGAGGLFRLVDQLPRKIAMELILTGAPITAARALELNLINRVVAQPDVLPAALALAEQISENAPLAVQTSKRVALGIVDGAIAAESARWELSAAEGAALAKTWDAAEGPRAFAEKRVPSWRNR
ncbi:enoyl-CoA hydratase-related protein [Amycolatopsis pithecellobii]|uniref:enoyl-CoA hydratase n=1 Tax=Amycolatopsis pithecellobii TaxID=664692 RepID=A0A6N7YN95_9PSEU|nr:enoyl-CoA hydratase-related protein [Amycolatopsis pithecellobii]MTD54445.1 enoyl-CoA hydratase [Amycolatopsis pithecellobii]